MTSPLQNGTVLVVAGGWHDERPGGANKLPTDFARFLAGRGYPIAYLCPSDLVEQVTRTEADGVGLWRYPSPIAPSPSVGNVRQHVRWVRHAMRALVAERPVTTLLGHTQLQYLVAATVCPTGVRRCYAAHSPFAAELRENVTSRPTLKQRLSWLGAKWMERRILQISDLVHCDSEYARGLMVSAYSDVLDGKTLVLPGWVDGTRFRPSCLERSALRARLGAPWMADRPTFFTLRRLVPRMGLDTLIEAAASLTRNGRAFRLIVGGEGPERLRLEALAHERGIGDRVAFIGRVAEDRIVDSFAAADCFVLPTRALECFGLIVLESYACGVPVIGVPVGSIPEVMGAGFGNWIADDNRAPALARRMDEFLSGRLSADPARLRARALEFDWASVAQQHERALFGVRHEGPERRVTGVDDVLVTIGKVIGKPPGWERVVRAVAPPRRFANLGLRQRRTPEGYMFPLDRGTLLGWNIHFFGSYEPEVRDQFKRWLRPGDVAIDVGANVGWHTLLMASLVGRAGRVYAFEPNESTRTRLLTAIDMNALTQVVVDPRAASEEPGVFGFQAPVAGDLWDGTGRLIRQEGQDGSACGYAEPRTSESEATLRQAQGHPERSRGTWHQRQNGPGVGPRPQWKNVECVSLDAFAADRGMDRLALVKIDVEGWELSVLRGARRVLDALGPALVFEYDPVYVSRCGGSGADLSAYLADRGYTVFALKPRRKPKRVTGLDGAGGNFLAVPREAVDR